MVARYLIVEGGVAINSVVADQSFAAAQGWVQQGGANVGDLWNGSAFTAPAPVLPTQEELDAADAKRIASLWKGAHDYETAQISGSAIGLLAIGVMQSLPKCLAVQAWIKSIWTLYYARKAGTETSTDYTSCGTIPHSVPELMTELGV